MSTDSFNLAPAQSPAGATTATQAPQPPTSPAPKKKAATAAPDTGTLGGVVIPGAALTGFIGLCWMIHQFGLPAVLLGIAACAAAATAALVMKGRKGKQSVSKARKAAVKQSGGGGAGRTVLSGSKKGKGGGSPKDAVGGLGGGGRKTNRKPSGLGSGLTSGSTMGKGGPGGGPKPLKNSPTAKGSLNKAPKNTTPKTNDRLSRKSAALGGAGAQKQANGKAPSPRKNTTAPGTPTKTGRSGLLSRIKNRKNTKAPTTGKPGKNRPLKPLKGNTTKNNKKPNTPPSTGGSSRKTPKPIKAATARKLAKAAKANAKTKTPKTPKPQHLKTKSKKKISPKKAARLTKKGKAPKLVKNPPASHKTTLGRMRRTTYLVGKNLRKVTSTRTRMRIRKVISPARTMARRASNLLSPPLAHLWRYGTQLFLTAHMTLGTVRYMHVGPNWMRPLATVMHVMATPAARLLHASGSWTWLNRWMYHHTAPKTAPAASATPVATGQILTGQVIPPRPSHDPVFTPAPEGTPVSAHAAPLQQAADAVRQAGVMLLTNPADNMVGYEATLHSLADIQAAIGEVLGHAANTTRDNFKVNPAVAEAYDDSAMYAGTLADRVGEIPTLFRTLHEEQVENIENPTVQARKWDIAANE